MEIFHRWAGLIQHHIWRRERLDDAGRQFARRLTHGPAQIRRPAGLPERFFHDQRRLPAEEDHAAARLGEGLQPVQRQPGDRAERRHEDGVIRLAAEIFQGAAVEGQGRGERLFVDEVEVTLAFQQLLHERQRAGVGRSIAKPEAQVRIVDRDPSRRPALRQQISGAVRIGYHRRELFVAQPAAEAGASAARSRHKHDFLQIDAADILLVHDPSRLVDGRRRPVGGEALGERAPAAEHVRRRGGVLREVGHLARPDLIPDGVDARHLHVPHVLEEVPLGVDQLHHIFLMIQVDQILDAVGGAPVTLYAEKIVAEQIRPDVPVVRLRPLLFLRRMRREKRSGIRPRVVTLPLLEFGENRRCPRNAVDRIVRLVTTETQHGFSKLRAHIFLVLLVGPGEKLPRRRRVEIILQRVFVVLAPRRIVGGARRRAPESMLDDEHLPLPLRRGPLQFSSAGGECPAAVVRLIDGQRPHGLRRQFAGEGLPGGHLDPFPDHEGLHAQVGTLRAEFAAGEAARIFALVHQPDAHAAALGLGDGELDGLEPARREVGSGRAITCLDRDDTDALCLKRIQIAVDDFLGDRPIPAPPDGQAVLGRRGGEMGRHLRGGGIGERLPRPVRGQCDRGQQEQRQ